MSLDDRDWWREDRKRKEELYGGDFSLSSRPKKEYRKDIPTKEDTDVLNKPLSLVSLFVFTLICLVGIFIVHCNVIAVLIVALIGATMPEIMKLRKEKRAEVALKTIIYTVSIIAGTRTLVFIILLLITQTSHINSGHRTLKTLYSRL